MSEKLDRLPRWASDEIKNSRRRITELEEAVRLGTVNPDYPATNIHVARDHVDYAPSAFHSGRILLGGPWDNFVDFRYEMHAGQPRVYVHSGWSNLLVHPRSGNAIHLTTER